MRYPNCIFDLYGTLVDIHTDESPKGSLPQADYVLQSMDLDRVRQILTQS